MYLTPVEMIGYRSSAHLDTLDVSTDLISVSETGPVQQVLDDGILVIQLTQWIRHHRLREWSLYFLQSSEGPRLARESKWFGTW
jgi:hypothetical protein